MQDYLAEAILRQALKDWDKAKYQPGVKDFLRSELFEFLIVVAGYHETEVESIRAGIESGKFNRSMLRSTYH